MRRFIANVTLPTPHSSFAGFMSLSAASAAASSLSMKTGVYWSMFARCSFGIGTPKSVGFAPASIGAVCVCVAVIASRSFFRPAFFSKPLRDFVVDFGRDAEDIDGHQHDRRLAAVFDRERLRAELLVHALGLGAAEAEAVEPDRVVRRDVDLRDADLVRQCRIGRRTQSSEDIAKSKAVSRCARQFLRRVPDYRIPTEETRRVHSRVSTSRMK